MNILKSLTSRCLFAAIAGVLLAMPAAAEPTPIEVSANATWQHDSAKVRFPPQIDGFRRTNIVDYGNQRFDVSTRYFEDASQTMATLYLFRAPLPDVPMWHDRALISIRLHEALGTPDHAAAVTTTFAPPGSDVASGLLTVLPLSGRNARSTALAVFRRGRWLVKVRITSDELDTAQLGERIATFLTALPLDPLESAEAPVAAMADCADGFQFTEAARAARPSMAAVLELAVLADHGEGIAQAREGTSTQVAQQPLSALCRDAALSASYGVYRHAGGEDQYVLAFGDAGISASIQRRPSAVATREGSGEDYWVSYNDTVRTRFYLGFLSLPSPAQAIAAISGQPPLATVERQASGDSKITLAQDQLRSEV